MKLKDGFVLNKVGNSYLAVAVGERADEFHTLIRMNGSGAFLWKQIDGQDKTVEELVDALLLEYDVDAERAKADVLKFAEDLKAAGLLDE